MAQADEEGHPVVNGSSPTESAKDREPQMHHSIISRPVLKRFPTTAPTKPAATPNAHSLRTSRFPVTCVPSPVDNLSPFMAPTPLVP